MFNSQFPIPIRADSDLAPFHSDENWELRIEHCYIPLFDSLKRAASC